MTCQVWCIVFSYAEFAGKGLLDLSEVYHQMLNNNSYFLLPPDIKSLLSLYVEICLTIEKNILNQAIRVSTGFKSLKKNWIQFPQKNPLGL